MNPSEPSRQTDPPEAPHADPLEQAFACWQGELLGMLHYLTGNSEDARDALQEAFIKCWRRRDTLGEIENLRAWVFRVALNVGRDLRATAWRRRRKPLPEADAMVATNPPPHVEADRQERLAQVSRALLDLRPEEQEVFLLRQSGEMTYEEIAVAINLPVGTVKTRMRLALQKLRAALEGDA